MRVLALAFDGADFDLVRRLMGEGKLPTISRLATFVPLGSESGAASLARAQAAAEEVGLELRGVTLRGSEDLESAARLVPRSHLTVFGLAFGYQVLGQTAKAIESYERALSITR